MQVVPLTDRGVELKVTQVNKSKYLTLLAQHRLANQSRAETEHFLKGIYMYTSSLVPRLHLPNKQFPNQTIFVWEVEPGNKATLVILMYSVTCTCSTTAVK